MGILDKMFTNPKSPGEVTKAWRALQEQIERDEGAQEDRAWNDRVQDLSQRGFGAANMLAPGVSSAGGMAPGTGEGSGYQEPSSLDRWKSQINGLIESGNPVLQKKGLDMLGSYQQRVTQEPKAATDNRPTSIKEYLYAMNDGYKGSYQDWLDRNEKGDKDPDLVRQYQFAQSQAGGNYEGTFEQFKEISKAQTTIDMSDDYLRDGKYVDADGVPVQPKVGMKMDEANKLGWRIAPIPTAEEAKQAAAISQSLDNLDRLQDELDAGADLSGFMGMVEEFRAQTGFSNNFVDFAMNSLNIPRTPENVRALSLVVGLQNSLLAAYRGAQVGPKEQEIFNRQLPTPGSNRQAFNANLARTRADLAELKKLVAEGRNFEGSPLYYKMQKRVLDEEGDGGLTDDDFE